MVVGTSINEVSVTEEVVMLDVLPVREDDVLVSRCTDEVLVVSELLVAVSGSEVVNKMEWEIALLSSVAKDATSLVSLVRKEEVSLFSSVGATLISSVRVVQASLLPEAEANVCEEAVDSEMVRLSREGFTPE